MRFMWRQALALAAGASVLGMAGTTADAANRALLIGVSEYENRVISTLHGPPNDVTAWWRYLRQSGFDQEHITVLANGIPEGDHFPVPAAAPNHDDILRELDALAQHDYEDGDTVLIFYAGHGTTTPQLAAEAGGQLEAKGRDSVLLPADTGNRGPDGTIENAIVDDLIGKKLDAIRARGVDVFFVADACHSGGVTRGLGEEEAARFVDPELLGFTDEEFAAADEAAAAAGGSAEGSRGGTRQAMALDTADKEGWGELVAFFAVDSYNLAWEASFDFAEYQQPIIGEAKEHQRMGVFSNYLNRALMTGAARTYQDLFLEVVAAVAADPKNSAKPRPVPEGDLSREIGWRRGEAAVLRGFLDGESFRIPAGTFQGFDRGAIVTLYDPADGQTPVATGRVATSNAASALVSRLQWQDGAAQERIAGQPIPVRVTEPVTQFGFKVALPAPTGDTAARERASTLFAKALGPKEGFAEIGIEIAEPSATDVNLMTMVEDGQLWLLRPGEQLVKDEASFDKTFSIAIDGRSEEDVERDLRSLVWSLARAERLARTAETFSNVPGQSPVTFQPAYFREGERAKDGRDVCYFEDFYSPEDPVFAQSLRSLANVRPVATGNCDVIRVTVANTSSQEGDHFYIGAFFIDARGGVEPLSVIGSNVQSTCVYDLPAGTDQTLVYDFGVQTWDGDRPSTAGLERLVFLALRRDESQIQPNLCALAQPTPEATTRSMGDEDNELNALLAAVGGNMTRSGSLGGSTSTIAMRSFVLELDVQP